MRDYSLFKLPVSIFLTKGTICKSNSLPSIAFAIWWLSLGWKFFNSRNNLSIFVNFKIANNH